MPASASTSARIPWALRSDIEVHPAEGGEDQWTLRDPVKLTYFRVGSDELAFLRSLDGTGSLQDSVAAMNAQNPGVSFSATNLQYFLASALKAGLLCPVLMSYGKHLAADARRIRAAAFSRKLLSLISHRFRGLDPTPLLRTADRTLGWIFHPAILRLASVFILAVFVLLISRWSLLQSELPSIRDLTQPQNLLMLAATIVVIKILHELGHGLTCHHYGGECHEIGILLVGFLPLLYCDVSDSWLQKHRSKRMQVAAAGIAVELLLAAIFGLLWIASVPGMLHTFFLNVTLVCSVNTLLINGNPLLKYDGYYVLSDWTGIPNLAAESRNSAYAVLDRIVLGNDQLQTTIDSSFWCKIWMPAFGAASVAYRLLMIVAILLLIHSSLKAYGFESLSIFFAVSTGAGMLFSSRGFMRQRKTMVYQDGVWSVRAITGILVTTSLLLLLFLWPLPYSVEAPFTLTPGEASPLFVSTPGHSMAYVREGEQVSYDQTLFILSNPDLEFKKTEAEAEVTLSRIRLANLTGNRTVTQSSSAAIPAAEQAIENAERRLSKLNQRLERLAIKSPTEGEVLPARRRTQIEDSKLHLRLWEGSLLDPINQNIWAEEQTLACWVGRSNQFRAVLYVSQQDVDFVEERATVQLNYHSMPGSPDQGEIDRIGNAPELSGPQELTTPGTLLTDESGRLSQVMYAAHVKLKNKTETPPLYSTGVARIRCKPMSLASRAWRLVSHTFAFEL